MGTQYEWDCFTEQLHAETFEQRRDAAIARLRARRAAPKTHEAILDEEFEKDAGENGIYA
jgi:hypothetical protein